MAGASGSWGNNGSFWIGADGNVYVAGANGVNSAGKADTNSVKYWAGKDYALIDDPNAPKTQQTTTTTPAPTNPTGATHPVLNQAAVDNTQGTIDQLPGLLQSALASEDQNYANTNATFDQQQQTQQGAYDSGTTTNQQNYDSNFMDSIRAGVKGLGSLVSLLRGTGASGGTAEDQVRDVVGGTTADDIRGGADTLKNNQGQLDSSLATFMTDLKGKRQANADTHTNNARAIQRDSNTQLQDLYGKMAGFYGDAGDTGNANAWMAKAGGLTPTIAANTKTQTSAYDTAPVVVHAPNLTAFSAPSQPEVATAPSDGQIGSGIFAIDNRRKDNNTPAAAPTAPALVAQGA